MRDPVVDCVPQPCAAAAQLSLERAIFDGLAQGPQRLRLWRPQPALIATLSESSRPEFTRAAVRTGARGLPVHVRASGGGAVCLGPGSLVVSHFQRSLRNDIDASYRDFAGLLTQAVAALDVPLTARQVPDAYCDGRYDLAWQGRKVGGIAQRRRVRDGVVHVWIHAVLAVTAEAQPYPAAVRQFYADLGSPRRADPRSTTTLAHCRSATAATPGMAAGDDLWSRVADAVVGAFQARSAAAA